MKLHIGELVKEIIEKKGLVKSTFAKNVGMTNAAFHKNLNKKDWNSDLIYRAGELLEYNLFEHIAKDIDKPSALINTTIKNSDELYKKYIDVLEENRELRKEIRILRGDV